MATNTELDIILTLCLVIFAIEFIGLSVLPPRPPREVGSERPRFEFGHIIIMMIIIIIIMIVIIIIITIIIVIITIMIN